MKMTVASTILEQLGGNKFLAMTGATNLLDHGHALSFKIGRNAAKVTHVKITLAATDFYDCDFLNVRGTRMRRVVLHEGVCCDVLQRMFAEVTGLDTHL